MKWYVLGTILVFVVRVAILDYALHGLAGALGVGTAYLVWGIVPAAIYWFWKGRTKDDGKMRTSRVMFWWSFLYPFVMLALQQRK
jgi:hypothetical protein